jgi:hypothetical protein
MSFFNYQCLSSADMRCTSHQANYVYTLTGFVDFFLLKLLLKFMLN